MKKLLTILVLIMLIISFFQITSMYALYKDQIQGEYNTLLGAWEIKVNTTDVTSSGQVETFTIANDQLGYVSSEYIQAGKIAPNGQAYFDIVIDPSDTDVSVIYTIDIDTKATSSSNAGIELTDAIEFISGENYFGQGDDGQTNKTETTTISEDGEIVSQTTGLKVLKDGNSYTNIIPVNLITQGYKNYIRLYFKWKNVELNNVNDSTISTTENGKITIPLQINLKQYTGEVIGNAS